MKLIKFYPNMIEKHCQTWIRTQSELMPLYPKFDMHCPVCKSDDIAFKHYFLHRRQTAKGPQPRIDMHFKCLNCGFVLIFGVHVDDKYYFKIQEKAIKRWNSLNVHVLNFSEKEFEELKKLEGG